MNEDGHKIKFLIGHLNFLNPYFKWFEVSVSDPLNPTVVKRHIAKIIVEGDFEVAAGPFARPVSDV
eukprot:8246614-Ditylum_brightwellii.AAC.1